MSRVNESSNSSISNKKSGGIGDAQRDDDDDSPTSSSQKECSNCELLKMNAARAFASLSTLKQRLAALENSNKTSDGIVPDQRDDGSSKSPDQRECSNCEMLKVNAARAFASLSTLKQRLATLESNDKDRQQLEKINRDQATLIDEFRGQLKKSESERDQLQFDHEQMKITNKDLRRQLDDVLDASRKQKETVQRAKEIERRYAETLAALKAEHESREELVKKYSKMADYVESYEVQLKKVESEMQKLRDASSINNANISLYTQHCPPLLKLVLELGDISEKNSLLNASQRRRLMRYTTDFNLREALMRKGKLKEPNAFSVSNVDDSEDDELVEVLENIMSAENSKTGFDSSAKKTQQEGDGNKKMVDMVMPSNSKMIEESKKLSDDSDEEMQMNDRLQPPDEKKRNKKVVKEKEQKNQTESELRKPPQLQTQSPPQPSLRRSRRLANAASHEETFAEHLQRKLARGLPSSSSLSSASPSTSKISFSDVQHKSIHGKKSKPLWMVQSEMIEKRKAEKMLRSKKKSSNENEVNRESDATLSNDEEMSSSTAETSSLKKSNTAKSDHLLLNKKSEDAKRHSEDHRMQQSDSDGVMSLADDHLGGEDAGTRDEPSNVQEVDEYQCVCESRLSLWRRFSEVEPLLEMPNKPLNVADVPSSSLTSHPEMDEPNREQTPPIASSSVLEQDLFLSPSKATLDDSLGLSLSPSVSVDSLLSPDNTLNCVQDRILSESLLVDETSRRDVVASSSDELRSHRRRTQSSCGQQREESDDQIKLRSRSISIAVVSGRDYKRTASWEFPEGSHSPSLTSYQKSTLSRSAERNEKLKREEKSVLTRNLLFRKHQRLLSYSGTRSQEMIRTEHSHLQRRTMSCSIEGDSPMKVPVSPAKKSRTRRYSLRSVHEYRSESTRTSVQPSSPTKALPSNISALSLSSMKKVVTDEENNERMSSAESKNEKQELCEDVTRTLNGSDDDDVTTLSTLSPSTNEVMDDEHNNEKMSTTTSKSEKQGPCDEVAHLSPPVESPKTLNGPNDDDVRNVSILSSKCIDITKKVVTDEENDEKISSSKSKSGKQEMCKGTTHSVPSVQPSMALNRHDDKGVSDSKSCEQTSSVSAASAVSVESNPSSSVLVTEKPSEQLSESLIMEQVKEPTPHVVSKTLVELNIESSVTLQHDVQPEKPVDDIEEESVGARQIEVPKRVSRVKKDADNISVQHLPVVKTSKESVPEEAISIAVNVKDDSRQKLVSKDDRTQKTLKQSPSVPSQTKSHQPNVRKSIDETVTDAGKKEDSGVGSHASPRVTRLQTKKQDTSERNRQIKDIIVGGDLKRSTAKKRKATEVCGSVDEEPSKSGSTFKKGPTTPRQQRSRTATKNILEPTKQSGGEELTRKHQMSDEAATKRIRTCPIRMAAKRSLPKKESAPNMDDEGDKLTKDPQSTVASVSKQDKPCEKKFETRRRSPPKRSVNEEENSESAESSTRGEENSKRSRRTTRQQQQQSSPSESKPSTACPAESPSGPVQVASGSLTMVGLDESDEEDALCIVAEENNTKETESDDIFGSTSALPIVSDSESDNEENALKIEIDEINNDSVTASSADHISSDTESTTKKSSTASVTNEHVRKVTVSGPRLSSGKGEMYKKMHKLLSKSLPRGGVIPQKQTKMPTKRKKDESPINAKKLTKLDAEGVDRKAHQPKITTATAASSVKSVSQKKTAAPSTTILLSQPISRQPIRSHPQLNRTKNKSNEAMTESLVMHLLDEMVVARSPLAVIVKRFREAPISQLSSDRIVACIIKLLNTMDVGNMWPTMLTASKHGVVEQVASLKERNLFELINQICAEPQWSDVCQKLFMKLAVSIQRAESASVSQLGRDIRCLLIAARIASEEDCSSSTPDGDISAVLCGVLRHLILLLSADWIVPVLCYALAISPELIKEFLIGKEDSLLPIRTLIAVHLSDREDYYSLFSKMLVLAYNVSEDEQQCLRRMDCDNFKEMFLIVEDMVVSSENHIDLNTLNIDEEFMNGMSECIAIYASASVRLFPEKDMHIYEICSQALRIISEHPASTHQNYSKEASTSFANIFAETPLPSGVIAASSWRASNLLMLSCRLLLARIQLGSADDEYIGSFKCFLKQIQQLQKAFSKYVAKDDKHFKDKTFRLYSFVVDDWYRVLQPLI